LAREETVHGLAEVQAKHGGGSGIAFAWETQLLATPAPATQAASDSAERGAGRMEPAIWIAQGMSATAFSRADMPAASEGGRSLVYAASSPPIVDARSGILRMSPITGTRAESSYSLLQHTFRQSQCWRLENQALEKLRAN
jgi:hypothetical protein